MSPRIIISRASCRLLSHRSLGRRTLTILLGMGMFASIGLAQTYRTWDDGKNNSDDWSQKNNWSNNNKPGGNTEVARFAGSNAGTTSVDINSNQRTGGILFNSDLSVDISFTRTNRELSIRNGGSNYGIRNQSSRTLTFLNMMGIEANMTWSSTNASGGGMDFTNTIDTDGYDLTFLTTNASNFINVTGGIIDSGDIIKEGAGTLFFNGANSYTGTTTVNGGTLIVDGNQVTNRLANNSNVTINDGGTFEIRGVNALGTHANSVNFTINSGGTLDIVSGASTYGGSQSHAHVGNITMDGGTIDLTYSGSGSAYNSESVQLNGDVTVTDDSIIQFGSGANTGNAGFALRNDNTFTVSSGANLTVSAELENSDDGNDGFIKAGAGDMTLSGNNSYSGTTTINGGKLIAQHNSALGATSGDTTIGASGTLELQNNITIGSGESLTNSGNLLNAQDSNTYAGQISGTGTTTVTGGDLTLSGANTYSGTTTVSGGTLLVAHNNALGAATANAVVNPGGTLSLDGGITVTKSTGTLTLNSAGASATTGALHAGGSTGTTSQWIGDISLSGDSTISAADNLLIVGDGSYGGFSDTINLGSNTLTLHTPDAATVTPIYEPYPAYTFDDSNIVVNSIISGSGGLEKTGQGTATLISTNKNTFTGDTNITGGKLIVDGSSLHNSPVIPSANVTIGNSGSANNDTVILQMGQLASEPAGNGFIGTYDSGTLTASTYMTIYEDGLFNMNGGSNALSGLTLQGGHVTGGNATYSPLLTIAGDITTLASSQTSLIEEGELGMSKDAFTFDVADGSAAIDLQIDSIIHNGIGYTASATSTINKTGDGTLVFTNANDYVGITQVQEGILNIRHNTALGQTSTPLGSTGNGTVVSDGAQLQIQGGLTIGKETLTLSGTGISNDGALLNQADNNTYNGYIYLADDARINANTGTTLTIANTAGVNAGIMNGTSAGKNLTVGGAGDTTINGAIGSNVSDLTKDGTGTLTLAGYNAYQGATDITSGAVKVTHDNGLSGTGATVADGATLQFAQDATNTDIDVVGVDATINGTGIANGGAIQNLNGDNSYLGNITLASDSRITADSGSSLTLNGNVNAAGYNLDAGGQGNTTYNGVISGSGSSLTKTDSGTITLAGTGANTFSGGLNVNEGTVNLNKTPGVNAVGSGTVTVGDGIGSANTANLALQADHQMADTTNLVLNSDGRLQMGSATDTISTIAGTGQIDLGTGHLIIGDDNSSSTFGGTITGTGTLEKNGSGTLTLTNDISYDGTLEIGGGTLKLDNIDLDIAHLVITADSILDFSDVSSRIFLDSLSFLNEDITLNIINWEKNIDYFYSTAWAGATQDVLNNMGSKPESQIIFAGWDATNTGWDSADDQIYPNVPEPSTYGLILTALASALFAFKRLKRNRNGNTQA